MVKTDSRKEKKDKKSKATTQKKVASSDSLGGVKKALKKKKDGKEEPVVIARIDEAQKAPVEPAIPSSSAVPSDTDGEDMPTDFGPGDGDMRPERYWEAVGRRKTAIARVRLFTRGEKGIYINEKAHGLYFVHPELQSVVEDALKKMKSLERFRVTVKVSGGGIHSQAEAVRHGVARALVKFNPEFRKRLRRAGYMTRDPRAKERKKFGLKKARRAPQWAKR